MPQATKLRLVRRAPVSSRHAATASALSLVQQHAARMRRIHTLASAVATDTDALLEALRYFVVAPRRVAG